MKPKIALYTVLMSFAVVALMSSCDKNDSALSESLTSTDLAVQESETSVLRADQTKEFYVVKRDYLNYYTHYFEYQDINHKTGLLTDPAISSTNSLCGAASLMVATGMVANGEKRQSDYYLVNKEGLVNIVKKLQNLGGYGHPELYACLNQFLGTFVGSSESTTANRDVFKDFIKKEMRAGSPVVLPVVILARNRTNYSNDLHHEDGSNSKVYYIQNHDIDESRGYFGHFVVLVSLQIEPSGFGYVQYYDVLDPTKTLKKCSYKRLLDSNKMNSYNDAQYCAFAVKKKK